MTRKPTSKLTNLYMQEQDLKEEINRFEIDLDKAMDSYFQSNLSSWEIEIDKITFKIKSAKGRLADVKAEIDRLHDLDM